MQRTAKNLLFLIIILSGSHWVYAQDSSSNKQIWPELDIYYRINQKFRLYGSISGTRSNSEYTDGTSGIYIDYFAFPWLRGKLNPELNDTSRGYYWWFRAGYSYSDAPKADTKKAVNLIETETNNLFHLPAQVLLKFRNRFDWRFVNGDFQPIYRPRLYFTRNFRTEYLTFSGYVWTEYFFYLNDHPQNRLRLTFGSEIKVTKNMDFEVYYLHQFQNPQSVETLNAIGVQLNFYFKSKYLSNQGG